LIERCSARDQALSGLVRTLALERVAGFPNGSLFWNEVARGLIEGYNEPAARDAETKVRAFLATHLACAAADEPTAKRGRPKPRLAHWRVFR
jgi:hypothetical protein